MQKYDTIARIRYIDYVYGRFFMSEFLDTVKKAVRNVWQRPIHHTLDRRAPLRNWFHAQYHLPRQPRPLPPFYQARQDNLVNAIMARALNHVSERETSLATPTFLNRNRGTQRS